MGIEPTTFALRVRPFSSSGVHAVSDQVLSLPDRLYSPHSPCKIALFPGKTPGNGVTDEPLTTVLHRWSRRCARWWLARAGRISNATVFGLHRGIPSAPASVVSLLVPAVHTVHIGSPGFRGRSGAARRARDDVQQPPAACRRTPEPGVSGHPRRAAAEHAEWRWKERHRGDCEVPNESSLCQTV